MPLSWDKMYTLKSNLCDSEQKCNILQYSGIYINIVAGDVVYGYNVHVQSKLCDTEQTCNILAI